MAMKSAALDNPTNVERIEYMMKLTRECKWVYGKTLSELAEKWGLSYEATSHLHGEACRRMKAEARESIASTVIPYLADMMADAYADAKRGGVELTRTGRGGEVQTYTESPNVSRQTALKAAEVMAKISTFDDPKRIEVTGADGGAITVTALQKALAIAEENEKE